MKPLYIDNILNTPISERANLLITQPENQWFERKSVNIKPSQITTPVIAFANAEGGVLIIGIHSGVIEGLSPNDQKINRIRQEIHDHIQPLIHVQARTIPVIDRNNQQVDILAISVEPGDVVYEDMRGKCYQRVGDSSKELTFNQRRELEYNRGVRQYDGEVIRGSDLSDIDIDTLAEYSKKIKFTGGDPMDVLRARFLVDKNDQQTNACHLMFSKNPTDVFPQARLRITRFLSDTRGAGKSLSIESGSDRTLEGNIPYLINQSAKVIEELLSKRKALDADGRFTDVDTIIPKDAWFEGVVNALIHRSYSMAGDYVHVEIYPSRVEITNPGTFPGQSKIFDLMSIRRFARNPRIARACTDMGFSLELGEGIKRIVTEMRNLGYIDPVYTQNCGSVKLRLDAIARLSDNLLQSLPKNSDKVYNLIRMYPNGIGTGELVKALDMSRPTLTLRLQKLADVGLIKQHSKSATDPRAYWVASH